MKGNSDSEAIRMANNCDFALSSCAFSGNATRAKKIASQLVAGMSAVNDLEGCTYMSQSLPFGGSKKSGYDRFAGPEGLRGLCMIRFFHSKQFTTTHGLSFNWCRTSFRTRINSFILFHDDLG